MHRAKNIKSEYSDCTACWNTGVVCVNSEMPKILK